MTPPRKITWIGGLVFTIACEVVTLICRFGTGVSAVEFNRTAPLWMQIHHMFWAAPFFLAAAIGHRKAFAPWCRAIGIGLVASDLAHHFIVLPLLVGETGWHWP